LIIGNLTAFFLLLLIPIVLMLHILLRRMESRKVSSLLIWEKVNKKRKYKFPTILLLLMQIILLSIITLSLADIKVPFTIPLRKENSVLIIDNSASMNVVENGQSRLDDAKDKAINVLKGSSGETMIITAAKPPQIISSYTNDRDKLIEAVQSIKATELSNGIEEVMKISSASVTASGSIIMISDGAFDYIPSETSNFKFIRAGMEMKNNVGITDFFLREKSDGDSYELYMTISNFSGEEKNYHLNLYRGDEIIEKVSESIEAGAIKKQIFNIRSEPEKEIRAELDINDLLITDNRASTYISSNKRKRILLVTPGNFFLTKALESIPEVYVETYTGMLENESEIQADTEPLLYSSSGIPIQKIPDSFDVVIYDRIPPQQKDKTGRFIYIDVIPSGLRNKQQKIQPQAVSVNREHPVLDSVDFSGVSVLEAWPPIIGPHIMELVSGGNTGLLYALESKFLKFLYIPFDLTDSDLPLRASFPVLISNSVNWLTDGYKREEIIQLKTGDSFIIGRADPDFDESSIVFPTGKRAVIQGNYFDETNQSGLYKFEYADTLYFGAVNLNSSDESNITSRFPEVSEEDREEKTGEYKFPMITIFLILALITLTAEWMIQEEKW